MKKKRFLQLLESKLSCLNEKDRNKILINYEKNINKRVFYGEKESSVVKSYGDIDELAAKIIDAVENDKFAKVLDSVKNFFRNIFKKKDNESIEVVEFSDSKEKKKLIENIKERISHKEVKETNESIDVLEESDTEKKSLLEKIKERFNHEKEVITENPVIIEETKSEPLEVQIDERVKKIEINLSLRYKIYGILLSFALVLFVILFLISVIGLLDGTVFFGITLLFLGLLGFIYVAISIWYKKVFNKDIDYKKIFYFIVGNLIVCGLAIGLSVFSYFKYEEVDDVSNYYIMAKEIKEFDLPKDETLKYYVDFNSNYKSKYRVTYDDTLDGSIKVEVNYFRNYYNLNFKTYRSSLYVSFHKSFRNSLSTFLEGTRDKKIYNNDEFERYTITIYMNSADKDRVIINN